MATSTSSDGPAIRTVGLTKRFGPVVALDDLTIEVAPGEVFGFLGPNGAGKTTTVRALLGLARPSAGRCEIHGQDVWTDRRAALTRVAHVPGEFSSWPQLRGGEMLDLLGALHGGAVAGRREQWCERFEFDPSKRGREYSKGNRQKITLIAALMVDADVLVLDEPTSGLDPLMEQTFREAVREVSDEGTTVFLSSHLLSEVEALCDRVAILRAGRLVDVGTIDDLRAIDARVVRVVIAGVPPVLAGVPGVSGVIVERMPDDRHQVHLDLRGEPGPLLSVLAAHHVVSLDIREPSLEEVFLTFYGDSSTGGRAVPPPDRP